MTGKGQRLYNKAKTLIPGGNMFMSKRPEIFLPERWPAYFSKAKGCDIWDLDGNRYTDLSMMSSGTNILGYGDPDVDAAVKEAVEKGNMSTLNCPEEVIFAERLIDLHPWANRVKLARSGGEANAMAVRIARAASGKDQIAVCGYHGWHDWYLSVNLTENDIPFPGLQTGGVPGQLRQSIFPFSYNNFDELKTLVDSQNIGVIKMEVSRNELPGENYLQKIRSLADDKGIVLVFDEITSGFRQSFGGMHKIFGVEPDIAIFGKALGNGYAISAVIGKKEVMEASLSSHISSTYWSDRIGPAAALKALEVMERAKSWQIITETGKKLGEQWLNLGRKFGLNLDVSGSPAIPVLKFNYKNALQYKTLLTQEMLKSGYLATTSVFICICHTDEVIGKYLSELEAVFSLIRECEDGRDVNNLLEGPLCQTGFRQLN